MWTKSIEERYQDDPIFHELVSLFYAQIDKAEQCGRLYTPSEIREAAILAMTLWESVHIKPILMKTKT